MCLAFFLCWYCLVTMYLALCSLPWLAGPRCSASWPVRSRRTAARVLWFRLQKTAESPQLQFSAGHRHPVRAAEADPHGPDNSADHREYTVAVRIWLSMSPICGPCSLSGAAVEKTFVLPQLQLVEKLPPVLQTAEICWVFRSCSSSRSFTFLSWCRGRSPWSL